VFFRWFGEDIGHAGINVDVPPEQTIVIDYRTPSPFSSPRAAKYGRIVIVSSSGMA